MRRGVATPWFWTAVAIGIGIAGCGAPPPPGDAGRDAPVEQEDAAGDQSRMVDGDDGVTYCPAGETVILGAEEFYTDAPEPEADLPGPLEEFCEPLSPGGRNHCFWLRDVPVYSGAAAAAERLRPYVGFDVVIR